MHAFTLAPALPGERFLLDGDAGPVAVYGAAPSPADGAARPLLLVHSINASGSAYEMRPLYEAYRSRRPVYALDLPGFGSSERSDRPYLPRLMTDAILSVGAEVQRRHGGVALDAVALSLSCEYLARAAGEAPGLFRSLALISPTGLTRTTPVRGPPGSTRGKRWILRIFQARRFGRWLYAQLTRPGVIRYFLERTWGQKRIDEGLFAYDLLTTRQPGAEYAPLHFLSAYLFSGDATALYEALKLPAWIVHGVRGDFVNYRYAPALLQRSNWSLDVLQTGALPHFEVLEEFVRRYDAFLAAVPDAPSLSAPLRA